MTTVIFVRHGFSKANEFDYFGGQSNFPLTDIGYRQAERVAEKLIEYPIDKIYASDLRRAYKTAVPISGMLGIPIIKEKGFREINGGLWECYNFSEISKDFFEDYSVWMNNFSEARPTDGESTRELYLRVTETLSRIAAENPDKTVCISTHATPIRAAEAFIRGSGAEGMNGIRWVKNASVNVASYDNGKWEIVDWNMTDHLGDLETSLPKNI